MFDVRLIRKIVNIHNFNLKKLAIFRKILKMNFIFQIILLNIGLNRSLILHSGITFRCEPDCGNRVRLCRLKPNTDYYIQLRASLEELGLQGKPSKAIRFHTLSTVPECLYPPRFISSTSTSITISWKSAIDNGSKIISYRVQIAKVRYFPLFLIFFS